MGIDILFTRELKTALAGSGDHGEDRAGGDGCQYIVSVDLAPFVAVRRLPEMMGAPVALLAAIPIAAVHTSAPFPLIVLHERAWTSLVATILRSVVASWCLSIVAARSLAIIAAWCLSVVATRCLAIVAAWCLLIVVMTLLAVLLVRCIAILCRCKGGNGEQRRSQNRACSSSCVEFHDFLLGV